MRKLFFGISCAVLFIGAATLAYDVLFIHRYGLDSNEVLGADGPWLIDWETGRRPFYANYPAWAFGLALCAIGGTVAALVTKISKRAIGKSPSVS